jgi:hypothetical protein
MLKNRLPLLKLLLIQVQVLILAQTGENLMRSGLLQEPVHQAHHQEVAQNLNHQQILTLIVQVR